MLPVFPQHFLNNMIIKARNTRGPVAVFMALLLKNTHGNHTINDHVSRVLCRNQQPQIDHSM